MLKEYSPQSHYEALHGQKYKNSQGRQRREKVNELLTDLKKQQAEMNYGGEINDAAVKASYLVANEITLASQPFSEGELVKTCMLKAEDIVCPEKSQTFANISLTRNSIRRDFCFFGRFGQPTEEHIKVIYCVFSCNS